VSGPVAWSVVVPSYRSEATIRACLQSVLRQDLAQPFEVIVVDSGDDETAAIVEVTNAWRNETRIAEHFTIDADKATRVIDQLRPRLIVVPMHYRTPVATISQLAPIDDFLAGKTNVRRLTGNRLQITAVKSRPASEIVVMGYR